MFRRVSMLTPACLTSTGVERCRDNDFRCTPPQRIVAERPRPGSKHGFDIIAFYARDPQFAELLSHYRVRSRTSLETYELASPWAPPTASACRL